MPQMAPMNWLILYMMFSITFLLFNFLNYYKYIIKSKASKKMKFFSKTLNWKW
uniref:ATP synthase complex subunit 8 n=1 Tax=Copelatus sp. MJTNT-2012 TaxID=1216940 RepID=U3L052_9DYTI|nr:ATP synthase F0 subunit 8 [Copelatus sp. MJTNT-2012]